MSVGLSIEKSGQRAEWYITRDVGALLREARGSSAATRSRIGHHGTESTGPCQSDHRDDQMKN